MSSCPNCGFPMGPHPNDPSFYEETSHKTEPGSMTLESVFGFGKYEGKTVNEVLKQNPSYLLWINANVTWVSISDSVLASANRRVTDSKLARDPQEYDDDPDFDIYS